MHPIRTAFIGLLVVLLIGFITWQIKRDNEKAYPTEGMGVEFTFPEYYFSEERELQNGRIVTLTEDTAENRELRAGTTTPAREGPVAITVARYKNTEDREVQQWIREIPESNFHLAKSFTTPTEVDNEAAFRYSWSGLYEGESVVVRKGDSVFVFSVTYLTPQDRIRSDFEDILKTVSFD